ncbi:hypothetical protein D8M04_17935 [Oceanobacillus piezotolerans]|uniref:WD40 repeat domain-containing protein n=1 Tax=Oceanobacillus piezotolerans TaxID=2448030 RepID=A0A498D4Y5_9BACI|nr:hypothetical protein [Oceanobacillus piezotolerans]RLL41123.1 hypothetical protein D8M04_17935 [Oceanobacillus piezotolerans]
MRKVKFYFVGILFLLVIGLAACGNEDPNEVSEDASAEESGQKEKTEVDEAAGYEEVESFDLEGPVTVMNFSLDEDGDTLLWGENDGGFGDALRRNVWVDGEVKELDIEVYGQFSYLTGPGHIITSHTDWDAPETERYSIIEYDPSTGETEEFVAKNDRDDILLPNFGTYIQDPRTYIHTVTNIDREDVDTYIWKVDNNEFIDLNFIKDIKAQAGEELPNYPNYFLNKDASVVYAAVLNEGLYSYDIATGETEKLFESDNLFMNHYMTTMLTSDEKYLVYGINDPTAEGLHITYHALDLETKESIELGVGEKVYTLTDGNVALIEENEVKLFDFETEELETVHTIELGENQELDQATISLDGNTIAYGYSTEGEEDEEDTSHMSILSNQ